jgi:hypothetical protein
VELARLAVASGIFPLYEVFNGRRYRINARPDGTPLEDYVARQHRFVEDGAGLDALRQDIAEQWARLEALAADFPTSDTPAGAHEARCWLRLLVEDKPSVLARVARQVSRRGVNIETVVVRGLPDRAHTWLTVGVDTDPATAGRLADSLRRLDSVLDTGVFEGACPDEPPANGGRR